MKSKILLLSILVTLSLAVSSVYAGALTVSVSIPTKSLTENEQVTVTVTVTNPSGTETDIITELSGGWFSVVQACSTISTLSAGQSGTSICIIKPTSTGTDLTLTARSEPSNNAANAGTGSTSGINIASQSSSLTASITAPSSVDKSATFYVGVTVTAPPANDVANARTTISKSGECQIDTNNGPDATQSLGNITKGTSESPTNWRLAATSSDGTCTVTVNVVSDVGGSASPSKSITVGSGGGGGDGGGGGTTGSVGAITGFSVLLTVEGKIPKVTTEIGRALITLPSIATGKFAAVDIEKTENLAFRKIVLYVKESVSNVEIKVTKLADKPASVTQEVTGKVYHYVQVDKNVSDTNVNQTTISFEVEKSWIKANNIDKSTITLYRYADNSWNKLQTTEVTEDRDSVLYDAVSPGLSIFAISGEASLAPAPEEKPAEEKKPVGALEAVKGDTWKIAMIIGIFAVAVGALVYFLRKKS